MKSEVYEYPAEETVDAVRDLFDPGCKFKLEVRETGYYITVSRMYGYVEFKDEMSILSGYMAVAALLECKEGDEVGRSGDPGCPTCGFGGDYEIELRFW